MLLAAKVSGQQKLRMLTPLKIVQSQLEAVLLKHADRKNTQAAN